MKKRYARARKKLAPRQLVIVLLLGLLGWLVEHNEPPQAPDNFRQAKQLLREQVYFDQHSRRHPGTLYCGCTWRWAGESGGRTDLDSCGYRIRAQPQRAQRIEWEHVVPASWLGRQRQCWQQGGRSHCNKTDPVFNRMEADLHNLAPVIGEINADRSNYRFGLVGNAPHSMYGNCGSKTDFKQRTFEPRDQAKGFVARVSLYMHAHYGLSMSKQQRNLLTRWHQQFPPEAWERERNARIRAITGQGNPYVEHYKSTEPASH